MNQQTGMAPHFPTHTYLSLNMCMYMYVYICMYMYVYVYNKLVAASPGGGMSLRTHPPPYAQYSPPPPLLPHCAYT